MMIQEFKKRVEKFMPAEGIELEEKWCEMAAKRMEKEQA